MLQDVLFDFSRTEYSLRLRIKNKELMATTALSVTVARQAHHDKLRPETPPPPSKGPNNDPSRSVTTLTKAGHFTNGVVSSACVIAALQPAFTIKTWIMSGRGMPPVRRLWDGLLPNALSGGPAEGAAFVSQEGLSQVCQSKQSSETEEFAISLLAGTSSAPINACSERIMTQQQLYNKPFIEIVTSDLSQPNKIRRVFYGTIPTMWRDAICNLGLFGMTDAVKRRLKPHIPNNEALIATSSTIAGGIAGWLSAPFDCVRTRMQGDLSDKREGMIVTTKKVVKAEGPKSLFKGAGTRSMLIGVMTTGLNLVRDKLPGFLPSCFHEER